MKSWNLLFKLTNIHSAELTISLHLYASSILFQQDFQQVGFYVETLSREMSMELYSI